MAFSIRRVGGSKRFLLLIAGGITTLYLLQSLYLNLTTRDPRRPVSEDLSEVGVADDTKSGGICGTSHQCVGDQLTFNISTSLEGDNRPQTCLNNLLLLSSDKIANGLNLVVIDEKRRSVQDIKYFDFSISDLDFIGFTSSLADSRIIIVSTWGNVASKLTPGSRDVLKKFGSQAIDDLKSDESFVLIGQKGLKSGLALEKIGAKSTQNSDASVELRGCLPSPMGELSPVTFVRVNDRIPPELKSYGSVRRGDFSLGPTLPNCGRPTECLKTEVSVSVYTGKNKDDEARICVNDRWLMKKNLNGGGRGLNIVVLNSTSKEILRLGHFDTYEEDSSTLEIFLEDLINGEMIVVASFDEASQKLSSMAKRIFYELGSGMIQNLKFRASWFFIGQKGVNGFTPFEEMTYASGSDWAKPIEQFLCVPPTLDGKVVRSDPTVHPRNEAKRHFCAKFDGYEDFCEESHLDDQLTPAPLYNKSLLNNPIFSVPILVVAGLNHNSLRLNLETLMRQQGLKVSSVLVTFDENYPESLSLAKLFAVKVLPVPASSSYSVQMAKSIDLLWTQFPSAEFGIVIEEELMLTADFLFYMAQMLPLLKSDSTIISVSAWNDNGFTGVSTMSDVAYRVEGIWPGFAFLWRKSTYSTFMQGRMNDCCSNRSYEGWLSPVELRGQYQIVPDVSRVIRRHSEGLGMAPPGVEDLFHRSRAYQTLSDPWINQANLLVGGRYESLLRQLIAAADRIDAKNLVDKGCTDATLMPTGTNQTGKSFVAIFSQSTSDDYTNLTPLLKCFGVYHSEGRPPRGLFDGVLRFSYRQNHILLVGSESIFGGKKSPIVRSSATEVPTNSSGMR